MNIALIIVAGITIMTAIAVFGDYFTKIKVAKGTIKNDEILKLERRVEELEKKAIEQENIINRVDSEILFTNRLLEDKIKSSANDE